MRTKQPKEQKKPAKKELNGKDPTTTAYENCNNAANNEHAENISNNCRRQGGVRSSRAVQDT